MTHVREPIAILKRLGWTCNQDPWHRLARLGVIATLGVLLMAPNAAPALGQFATNTPTAETRVGSGVRSEASSMATTVAVLHWQGEQGAENLALVSGIAVPNLLPLSEPSFDAGAEQTAVANAAATATAVTATEVALAVQATVEARATSSAVEAAALMATHEAESRVEAAAAASATRKASAMAAAATSTANANATAVAASVSATMEADAMAAAAVPAVRSVPERMAPLLIALIPIFAGLGGIMIWRSRKEPFVLKANPVSM
jgi:hypothetical protein